MTVFVNGEFVSEERAVVSVFDRGFTYGDGLFDTLRLHNGRPFQWDQHIERLLAGAQFLRIDVPLKAHELRRVADELASRNNVLHGVLRISLSRGIGPRGYSPKGASRPSIVVATFAMPELSRTLPTWRLVTSDCRVSSGDALAATKTTNKLLHVLARGDTDAKGADEALLRNAAGDLVEGTCSNLFWIERGTILTPPTDCGVLPGITRNTVLGICRSLNLPAQERRCELRHLADADGVFMTLSSLGIVEAAALDDTALRHCVEIERIRGAWLDLVREECGRLRTDT